MDRAAHRRRPGGARGGARTARVVLTRPEGRNEELAARLRGLGHDVTIAPLIAIEPVGTGPVDLDGYDWLVLTSAAGARELKRRARGCAGRVAAIGQATADAWGPVDLVPKVASQEGLLAEIPRPAGRVLFAGAESARPLLAQELQADVVVLYRTRALNPRIEGDLAVVASPSAARVLAEINPGISVVSIGPETTSAARDAGLRVLREAATADVVGLVSAVQG